MIQSQQGAMKAELIKQKSQAETCWLCKLSVVNTFKEEHKAGKLLRCSNRKTTLKLLVWTVVLSCVGRYQAAPPGYKLNFTV